MRPGPAREVGGYELLGPLGSGGSGTVYRARDADGRIVALKLLHPHLCADADARERLAREVANLRKVRHPSVAQVLDAEIDSADAFVVTELVRGVDLAGYVTTHGPLRPAELAHLAERLHTALTTVHAAGVLHRDLSPGNVMITDDAQPVLIDFGIAQAVEDPRVTSHGLVTGTPGYVAPEMLEGGEPSVAGDWWGWAALLAFAATGRPPFGPGSAVAALARVRSGQVDLGGIEPRAAAALRSALAADPWRRATPEVVIEELNRAVARQTAHARDVTVGMDSRWRTKVLPASGATGATQVQGPPPPPPDWEPGEGPPLEDFEDHLGPQSDAGPLPPRRSGTVLAFALALVAFGVAWPVGALLLAAVLVVLVRSVGLDAEAVHRRWTRRGERRSFDVVRGVLAWPWHLARAVVGAVPSLVVGGAVAAGVWLLARRALVEWVLAPPVDGVIGVVPGNAEWVGRAVLAVAVLAGLLGAWFGPWARPSRTGARWVLSGLGEGAAAAGALVLALLASAAVLAALMITQDVVWWPFAGTP